MALWSRNKYVLALLLGAAFEMIVRYCFLLRHDAVEFSHPAVHIVRCLHDASIDCLWVQSDCRLDTFLSLADVQEQTHPTMLYASLGAFQAHRIKTCGQRICA